MDAAIAYIKSQNIQNYIQVVKILMESAEKQAPDGQTKFDLVLDAWRQIAASPEYAGLFGNVSIETVSGVVEAIILATKTSIAINKSTGCWSGFMSLFKKKTV